MDAMRLAMVIAVDGDLLFPWSKEGLPSTKRGWREKKRVWREKTKRADREAANSGRDPVEIRSRPDSGRITTGFRPDGGQNPTVLWSKSVATLANAALPILLVIRPESGSDPRLLLSPAASCRLAIREQDRDSTDYRTWRLGWRLRALDSRALKESWSGRGRAMSSGRQPDRGGGGRSLPSWSATACGDFLQFDAAEFRWVVPEVHLGTSMRKLNSSSSFDNSIGGTSFIHVDNVATVILILLLYSSIWLSCYTVLEHCDNPNTQQIVMGEILHSVSMLTQDQDGNYAVQKLSAMMKDQFGNYAVQKVLQMCDVQQRELILSRIKLQRACTALGDHGEENALPTLWDSLPAIAVVGGQVSTNTSRISLSFRSWPFVLLVKRKLVVVLHELWDWTFLAADFWM
ncbi:hypothetical protein ZIOFF_052215 [Zingiber officinale]|uniref:PUM-HD domain-containing protein n=1 Tax=Zingiber officinale TaxID=94328 RepID=A0A8J5FLP7_ZINOF|nr:hypothetical protein ZIOFF_052215 [Zingiber officinale]